MSAFSIGGVTPDDDTIPDINFPPMIQRERSQGMNVAGGAPSEASVRFAVVGRSRIKTSDATWYYDRLGLQANIGLYDPENGGWVVVSGVLDEPSWDRAIPGPTPILVNFRVRISI